MTNDEIHDLFAFMRLAWCDPNNEERSRWLSQGRQLDVDVVFSILTEMQDSGSMLPPLFDEVHARYAERIAEMRSEAVVDTPEVAEESWRPSTPAEKNKNRRGLAEARERLKVVS